MRCEFGDLVHTSNNQVDFVLKNWMNLYNWTPMLELMFAWNPNNVGVGIYGYPFFWNLKNYL